MDIILASASPRRKELLQLIFDQFQVIPSQAKEIIPPDVSPEEVPKILAGIKCLDIADSHRQALVIGCDTVVICEGKILGKPKNKDAAFAMLKTLSGKRHSVVTGCHITLEDSNISFHQTTEVTFYPLSDREISEYIENGEPFDKAGAYGIQGKGALFVKEIAGDYFNVVGLPVARLSREIQNLIKKAQQDKKPEKRSQKLL